MKSIDFIDEKGNAKEIIIENKNNIKTTIGQNYKLQHPEFTSKYLKNGAKAKGIFTSEIGVKSEGFAPIFTLALIISLGLVLIAFLMWRL